MVLLKKSTCPECGEVIGGTQHHVVSGNKPAADLLRFAGMEELIPTQQHML